MLVRTLRLAAILILIGSSFRSLADGAEVTIVAADQPPELSPREKVEQALDKVTSVKFEDAPLSDVVEHLRNEWKLEIRLDRKACAEAGTDGDTPITCNLHGITARSILRLMLRARDLTYVTEDEFVVITSPEAAAAKLQAVVYPVDDLIGDTNAFGEPIKNYTPLINTLTTVITPNTWDDVGGPGTIVPQDGKLVISQTADVHKQITEILATLRQLKNLPADVASPAPIHIGRSDTSATTAVRKALQQTLPLEFAEAPLTDVCEFLRSQLKVEVQLDTRALEDAAIAFDTRVNFRSKTASLAAALRMMFKELALTYILKDEVLLITTPDKAATELKLMALPIHDFFRTSSDPFAVFQQLDDMVTTSVRADSWDDVGGPCTISAVRVANTFLISGDEQVLADVEDLFTKLRLARTKAVNAVAAPELQTRMYRVKREEPQPTPAHEADRPKSAEAPKNVQPQRFGLGHAQSSTTTVLVSAAGRPTIDEIVAMIKEFVEPESWTKGDAYIRVFGDELMIRQTPANHRRIDNLLRVLGGGGQQGAPGC